MEQTQHNDDLWNVEEGDIVEIVTSESDVFEAECISRKTENADPRTGEVRETHIWHFSAVEWMPVATITNGLKSSESDPDFPVHSELWCINHEQNLGYINEITVLE